MPKRASTSIKWPSSPRNARALQETSEAVDSELDPHVIDSQMEPISGEEFGRSADTPSPSLLKHLLKGERGAAAE